MKWNPRGKDGTVLISSDDRFSINHTAKGWQAWQRRPFLKRIGDLYELAADAKQHCEQQPKETA
jgi:hypothetical protein